MKSFLTMLAAMLAAVVSAAAETVDFAFSNESFWGAGQNWKSSFAAHEGRTGGCTVIFKSASRQDKNITDVPVVKNTEVTVRLTTGKTLSHIEFALRQWLASKQAATLSYSTDGAVFSRIEGVSLGPDYTIGSDLPAGTVAVRLATLNSSMAGVAGIEYSESDSPIGIRGFRLAVGAEPFYDGCRLIVTDASGSKAMGSSQTSDNSRKGVDVTVCGDIILPADFKPAMAVVRLDTDGGGKYSLYCDNGTAGYLRPSDTGKKGLVTGVDPCPADVSAEAGGMAEVRFAGVSPNNLLAFDPAGNTFTCVENGPGDLRLYVYPEPEAIHPEIDGETVEGEYTLGPGETAVVRFPSREGYYVYQRFLPGGAGDGGPEPEFTKYRGEDIELSSPGVLEYYVQDKDILSHGLVITSRIRSLSVNLGSSAIVETPHGEAPVEYYSLQGHRVSRPAGGIFVRVSGGKAAKVAL